MIDVVEEQIERRDPLAQSSFDMLPFVRRNNAWDKVERKNALSSFLIVVNGESDTPAQKCVIGRRPLFLEVLERHSSVTVKQSLVMPTNIFGRLKHLVKE